MAEQAQIAELREKMREERDHLLEIIEGLTEEQAEQSTTGEGEWSAKQQMSHLCEMESAYRAWVQRALDEDGANVDGVFGEPPGIPLEQAQYHSTADHLAEMRHQRRLTDDMIAAMSKSDFDRRASNKLFGSLTVMQWLRSYYRHDRMHIDQLTGQEPTYRPQYAGGHEPDQRRG
jgi:hypothetical protein